MSEQKDVSERARLEAQKAAEALEELWKAVLQTAEDTQLKAERRYLLSREMKAFKNHAGSTKSWTEGLQEQADSLNDCMQGSQAQLEERLNTAQVRDTEK